MPPYRHRSSRRQRPEVSFGPQGHFVRTTRRRRPSAPVRAAKNFGSSLAVIVIVLAALALFIAFYGTALALIVIVLDFFLGLFGFDLLS